MDGGQDPWVQISSPSISSSDVTSPCVAVTSVGIFKNADGSIVSSSKQTGIPVPPSYQTPGSIRVCREHRRAMASGEIPEYDASTRQYSSRSFFLHITFQISKYAQAEGVTIWRMDLSRGGLLNRTLI
ncbi:hypothetical protein GDO78_002236 [Eleutherodactylus coqui]|uniref:Uncharacterized protein n=1 Tax=Eleutherodactylus coqui TaxID=57060 RepID=A0A8J6EVE9_ELECQ|nr:hypothetical protein GDO78_002236 [Eleutherodactylus coqui]